MHLTRTRHGFPAMRAGNQTRCAVLVGEVAERPQRGHQRGDVGTWQRDHAVVGVQQLVCLARADVHGGRAREQEVVAEQGVHQLEHDVVDHEFAERRAMRDQVEDTPGAMPFEIVVPIVDATFALDPVDLLGETRAGGRVEYVRDDRVAAVIDAPCDLLCDVGRIGSNRSSGFGDRHDREG